ncbi:hypothetical protein RDWZM_010376 [Blomia tropicalis]|uniref:Uncharacterized protein n=1 Tax=Blomia tropicalis TaxID=40697 RepID=A0A9Q0RK18_BLOTA|nr:hypothetical protein RDWZM_010376 [Blomia tropicalis]
MKDNFENFCKLQPNCKIQLGFRYYATEFGYMIIEMKPFVYSSNITVLDLFKYDNRINWNKMGMKMNIERINQFIRYAPNVHTLKIILRDCSPIDWSQLLKRMSLLTKLEIICWYDEKLWPKNFCTTMPNIRHLTLFITKESHDQVLKLLSIIKFPSLQTFTLRPVNTRWTECRKCFHSKQPQDRCVRYVYVELVKHSTDLKAFFAFKREWSIIFLNEN